MTVVGSVTGEPIRNTFRAVNVAQLRNEPHTEALYQEKRKYEKIEFLQQSERSFSGRHFVAHPFILKESENLKSKGAVKRTDFFF